MCELPEASAYFVPHWDCPSCGNPNSAYGQDEIGGRMKCDGCGEAANITD